MITVLLATFLFTYVPLYYIFNNFIIERLKPIFNTINTIKIPTSELYKNLEDKNIINEVKNEVIDWAKLRIKEIVQLKTNEKYRKEFMGNVSHELKTPIFNIQGYIQTLIDGGLDDPEINMKYLIQADKNINRMIAIVNDLETISRLESGELKLNFKVYDIVQQVKEIFEMYEMMAQQNKISLIIETKKVKEIMVYADRKKISQVLINLIVNSLRYGNPNGYTKVKIRENGEKVIVRVEDNGIGIAEENLNRIFERFFRVDKSRSRDQGGTGLGLAIVKHIIEGHNQSITVESIVDKGTTFRFTLDSAFM